MTKSLDRRPAKGEMMELTREEVEHLLIDIDGRTVAYHCIAPPRTFSHDDTPLEYAIVEVERNCPQGIVVYGKYETHGWIANPSLRGLVNHFRAKLAAIRALCDSGAELAEVRKVVGG